MNPLTITWSLVTDGSWEKFKILKTWSRPHTQTCLCCWPRGSDPNLQNNRSRNMILFPLSGSVDVQQDTRNVPILQSTSNIHQDLITNGQANIPYVCRLMSATFSPAWRQKHEYKICIDNILILISEAGLPRRNTEGVLASRLLLVSNWRSVLVSFNHDNCSLTLATWLLL